MTTKTPHYHLVPKSRDANIKWRRKLIADAVNDPKAASEIYKMCAEDILFYINSFVFTFDPRPNLFGQSEIPWITYGFQDEAILKINDAINTQRDVVVEKSRDMGASWICVAVPEWRSRFMYGQTFGVASRKEEYVDKLGDAKSLFEKLRQIDRNLPAFLRQEIDHRKMHREWCTTHSTIDGESTTGDFFRGARYTALFLDEFAFVDPNDGHRGLKATQDATDTRIFNSTPNGAANAFYEMVQRAKNSDAIDLITLHWTKHPVKAKGLTYEDGKPTSPWHKNYLSKCDNPQQVAQELDIDYEASDFTFFDTQLLDRLKKSTFEPVAAFEPVVIDPAECTELHNTPNGRLKVWVPLDRKNKPPADRHYAIGIDVAMGSKDAQGRGASNSVLSIIDYESGEKVAEYAANGFTPPEFARIACAIGRWFHGADKEAFLCWEANGPGRPFEDKVIDLGYKRFYHRPKSEKSKSKAVSNIPGWWSTKESKYSLLTRYRQALIDGDFLNRSRVALNECRSYVSYTNGSIAHSGSVTTGDASGARDNHGDRVIADALSWLAIEYFKSREPKKKADEKNEALPGSYAWRKELRSKQTRDADVYSGELVYA